MSLFSKRKNNALGAVNPDEYNWGNRPDNYLDQAKDLEQQAQKADRLSDIEDEMETISNLSTKISDNLSILGQAKDIVKPLRNHSDSDIASKANGLYSDITKLEEELNDARKQLSDRYAVLMEEYKSLQGINEDVDDEGPGDEDLPDMDLRGAFPISDVQRNEQPLGTTNPYGPIDEQTGPVTTQDLDNDNWSSQIELLLEESRALARKANKITGNNGDYNGNGSENGNGQQGQGGGQKMNVAGFNINPWAAGGFAAATIAGIVMVNKNS